MCYSILRYSGPELSFTLVLKLRLSLTKLIEVSKKPLLKTGTDS